MELGHEGSRIIVDIGMPLVTKSGGRFDAKSLGGLSGPELVDKGILPNIQGFYKWDSSSPPVDGLLISHAHLDHFGFADYVNEAIPAFLSEATDTLLEINRVFVGSNVVLRGSEIIKAGQPFGCGTFTVTPYEADHSAFGSLAFVIEAGGKKVIYSGDFRAHGRTGPRKLGYFLAHAQKGADALVLEGTILGRENENALTEDELENEAAKIFASTQGIVLLWLAGQNIDRLVGFYKACLHSNRVFIVDPYTAYVLKTLSQTCENRLPYPSVEFKDIRVHCDQIQTKKLMKHDPAQAYELARFKIDKLGIQAIQDKAVMVIRPSMMKDLRAFDRYGDILRGSTLIYSMWEGYLREERDKDFKAFMEEKDMKLVKLHTSGHATRETLQRVIQELKPKVVVPIHTMEPGRFAQITADARCLKDGETLEL